MFYTRTVADRIIQPAKGDEINFGKSVAFTLIHNAIDFMVEKVDGQWEFVVAEKDSKHLDVTIRHLEAIQ